MMTGKSKREGRECKGEEVKVIPMMRMMVTQDVFCVEVLIPTLRGPGARTGKDIKEANNKKGIGTGHKRVTHKLMEIEHSEGEETLIPVVVMK